MSRTEDNSKGKRLKLAPEALFIFALIAILGYYAVWRAFNPPGQSEPALQPAAVDQQKQQQASDPAAEMQEKLRKQLEQDPLLNSPVRDELTQFYMELAKIAPTYTTRDVNCPFDNTALELPVTQRNAEGELMDNSIGGIASDFMKIAVGPPSGTTAMPDLLVQQWEQLPVTCPNCGNTFQESTLNNLRWPQRLSALRENWNLEEISPGLASIDTREWTPDLQHYGHYLSSRAADMEHLELGWLALSGAYASNFSVWSGEHEYYIPSAAFYALAAAEFRRSIELDWEGLPDKSKSETIMALLVCERLLGRDDAAAKTLAMAQEIIKLEPRMQPALDTEQQYLAEQRYSLERVVLPNQPKPLIGWQLDKMLPGMNGHIAQYREDWSGLDSIDEIVAQMESTLQSRLEELNNPQR